MRTNHSSCCTLAKYSAKERWRNHVLFLLAPDLPTIAFWIVPSRLFFSSFLLSYPSLFPLSSHMSYPSPPPLPICPIPLPLFAPVLSLAPSFLTSPPPIAFPIPSPLVSLHLPPSLDFAHLTAHPYPGTPKREGTAPVEPALPPLQPLRPRAVPGDEARLWSRRMMCRSLATDSIYSIFRSTLAPFTTP